MSMQIPTQQRNQANYRFGQDFTYENIRYAWRRQGYANKIVVGAVDDAIGKGFNIIDAKTKKVIKKNDEAWNVITTMFKDLKKTCHYDRSYGKGVGMFFLPRGESIPIWRAYDTRHYFVKYDGFARPREYTITNRVGGIAPLYETIQVIGNDLAFTHEIITREAEQKGEGISALEPVWDTLYALSTLDEQGTYFVIRYGAGIRYLKIPEAKFKDEKYMANIFAMLRGAIGVNGMFTLPYGTINGVKEEIEIASETGTQLRFLEIRDMILGTLSAQTGIPREVFLGSQIGLRSSEKNEDSYFDFLQSIQNDYRAFFRWVVNKLNELFGWFGKNIIIDIEYVSRDTMSTDEIIELEGKKIDIASKAGYKVPKDYLSGVLKIPLEDKEIDPLGINAAGDKKDDKDDKEDADNGKEPGKEDDDDKDDGGDPPDEDKKGKEDD